jgi:hypothetical protein
MSEGIDMLASRSARQDRRAIQLLLIGALVALLAVAAINLVGSRLAGVAAPPAAHTQTGIGHDSDRPDSGATSAGQAQTRSNVGGLTPVMSTDTIIIVPGGAGAGANFAAPQDPICPNNKPCGP